MVTAALEALDGDCVRDFLSAVVVVIVLTLVFSFAPNKTHSGSGTHEVVGSVQPVVSDIIIQTPAVVPSTKKYICIKSFQISVYDADGNSLHRKATIHEGDIYEAVGDLLISPAPVIHLEKVGSDIWIEISPKTLKKYFEETE